MSPIIVDYQLENGVWNVTIEQVGVKDKVHILGCKSKRHAKRSADDILKHLRKLTTIRVKQR